MTAQLILWSHALAALVCGALALDQLAQPRTGWAKAAFVTALFATTFWALAVAGIDAWDFATQLAEAIRDLAWLALMFLLVRRDRFGTPALTGIYVAVAALTMLSPVLAAIALAPLGPIVQAAVGDARLLLGMTATVGALLLVHHLNDAVRGTARMGVRLVTLALAAMWGTDLLLLVTCYAAMDAGPLLVLRGAAMIGAGLAFAVAAERPDDGGRFAMSRTAALRALSGLAAIGYVGVTVLLTMLAERVAGNHARIAQTAIVLGAAVALLTLLSSPWLRAWTRVKLAKHLFRHRYDYRVEWQRFTDTLGRPEDGAALEERVVQAVADLIDAPAGRLLVQDGAGLGAGAAWNWDADGGIDEAYARHLATGRIVELDALRAGKGVAADADGLPRWIVAQADAWAIVPLLHLGTLVGAILLARPPIDRALDWEDFDLLRVAGRQAASYLAEQRAQGRLADAQRFDEFNRRFAFIVHDVKNLVSQLTLVARNAERHADNPEFRADMVATLKDSADRMNALLARLSQHHAAPQEPRAAVDVAALALRIAGRTRGHRVVCRGAGTALAQAGRLEQVLGHLVQNACEASAPGAAVIVAIAQTGANVAVTVEDQGCGMSPAFVRDELFRPFASSKPGGFGIGAFEAKQLVQTMGGSIAVTSRPGEGTAFLVTLPAAASMEAAA